MGRAAIAITALALVMAALPAASASGDYYSAIEKYDQLRQDIKQCDLDTNWGQFSAEARSDCDPLFARYILYMPRDEEILWIHCRSASTCDIERPDGVPDPNGQIPEGSRVFDVKPRGTTAAHKSRARAARHHHRRHH
jgi:hypothetical protein